MFFVFLFCYKTKQKRNEQTEIKLTYSVIKLLFRNKIILFRNTTLLKMSSERPVECTLCKNAVFLVLCYEKAL